MSRSFLSNGLSAETPFEFKTCAINEIGQGQWSEASLPKEHLHLLKDLGGVIELAESSDMAQDDWNVPVLSLLTLPLVLVYPFPSLPYFNIN
jgi:hypothetical protein